MKGRVLGGRLRRYPEHLAVKHGQWAVPLAHSISDDADDDGCNVSRTCASSGLGGGVDPGGPSDDGIYKKNFSGLARLPGRQLIAQQSSRADEHVPGR